LKESVIKTQGFAFLFTRKYTEANWVGEWGDQTVA